MIRRALALASLSLFAVGCPRREPTVTVHETPAPMTDSGIVVYDGGPTWLDRLLDPTVPRPTLEHPWEHHAAYRRGDAGMSFEQDCPPNGHLSPRVWGTTIYTDDSSICTAAVHAGLITLAGGGRVRVFLHPGRNGYVGSGDNDVLSRSYGWFPGSFAFTETIPEDVFPPPNLQRDR
ncbi:MAG: hypothetical protein JNK05_09350 [Myxococcales bacterium]|nr:hypothetical protein [Myxococcales bacterium]